MGDEDGSTARDGLSSEISADTRGGGGAPLDKRSQFIRQNRPATAGAALVQRIMPRRQRWWSRRSRWCRATKRANNAEMVSPRERSPCRYWLFLPIGCLHSGANFRLCHIKKNFGINYY